MFALALASLGSIASAQPGQDNLIDRRVAHAQQFTSAALLSKIRNNAVTFHWIGNSDRFWFRKTLEDHRTAFIVVDAASGKQESLFDTAAMTAALSNAGAGRSPTIADANVSADGESVRVTVRRTGPACSWPAALGRCTVPVDTFSCDLAAHACRPVNDPGSGIVVSPDGKQGAFVRNYNLWVRNMQTGQERQLTRAGVADFAYGQLEDQGDDGQIARRRAGLAKPPAGLLWSPDGRYILAIRHDLRKTPERNVVTEFLPPEGDRPNIYMERISIASDPDYPDAAVEAIDVAAGTERPVDADPKAFIDLTLQYLAGGFVWWSKDNEAVSLLTFKRGGEDERLVRIDMRTGRTTDRVVETSKTMVRMTTNPLAGPGVKILSAGDEAVWLSERDGWGHLYLYDLRTGRVKHQITKGAWTVVDLLRVDETTRTAYFTAAGREPGRNPYYRSLYSVGLDGGEPKLLTPDAADHSFGEELVLTGGSRQGGGISPSGRYLIDCYSTTAEPDRVVLRKIDGTLVAGVLKADISELLAIGWRPPEQFTVKAADGQTDLYGVMYKPINFDPTKKYPVIEITYPVRGLKFTPTAFWQNFTLPTTLNHQALAETGAVVLAFDGRGGGMRSVAFRDAFVGADDVMGQADHVAAIRNLSATHPYMDLDRVGVTGHSYGGYASLRAMLLYPDVFKVAVSGEGPGDLSVASLEGATERLFGIPTTPEVKAYYRRISNEALADRLKGKLLLIYGGADKYVTLQDASQIFMALQKANKVYDTLIMPDSPHYGGREPYGVMRTLRYFSENLGGSK